LGFAAGPQATATRDFHYGLLCWAVVRIDWKAIVTSGLAGVKRNALPGLALQSFALVLVLLYYLAPGARPTFDTVAMWKTRYGLGYSALATAIFGGAIPVLYLLASGQIPRERRRNDFLLCVLFWAYRGIEVDLFYRLQAYLFGDRAAFAVVAPKVLLDQFVYSVLVAAPGQVVFYLWKDRGFSFRAIKPDLNLRYLVGAVATVVFSQWMVWIPAVSIIYCLPLPLQIPLCNVVSCFWVLLLTFVSRRSAEAAGRLRATVQ
jgi:hypothetical protein